MMRPRCVAAPPCVTRTLALGVTVALGTLGCHPSHGTERPSDSADRRAVSGSWRVATEPTEVTLSVREVLETPGLVRHRVRVSGICVGYTEAAIEVAPPITRSAWILGAQDARVFVSGPFPEGCTATTRGVHPVTIVGEVAEDTIHSLGGPALPRRFLLRVR